MKSISIEIVKMKTTFQVNAGCFHLRVRTRELNRHVAPFISEKAFQSDHLLHAMSRFCIEWTMWTVKHATGHQSIQLPSSNSQVKAPSIHLKSCFQIDNFNRY